MEALFSFSLKTAYLFIQLFASPLYNVPVILGNFPVVDLMMLTISHTGHKPNSMTCMWLKWSVFHLDNKVRLQEFALVSNLYDFSESPFV